MVAVLLFVNFHMDDGSCIFVAVEDVATWSIGMFGCVSFVNASCCSLVCVNFDQFSLLL